MAINFHNAFGPFEAALKLRSGRAEVLSANLANADTPNFKAKDFDFHQVLNAQLGNSGGRMATTRAGHLPATSGGSADMNLQFRTPSQPSIDGNTVDEHIENAAFMENSLEFQVAFTLLNSRMRGMMNAIKGE